MTPIETYLQPLEGTVAQVHEKAALAVLSLRDNKDFITLFRFMNQVSGGALTSSFVNSKGESLKPMQASRADGNRAFPRFILDTILNNYKP